MGLLGNLFRQPSVNDLKAKINDGAILLDVRTKDEYRSGHTEGSVNIPLDTLQQKLDTLKKDIPIVAVCQSGMRSSNAVSFLKSRGYEAYNGGCWFNFR